MTIEQAVLTKLQALPPEKQIEVLDFTEFLEHRGGRIPPRPESDKPTRQPVADVFGDVRGRVRYHADLLEPTTGEWPEV